MAHAPDPLAWPDWRFVGGSRFDDPQDRFRVLYLAEQRVGCFIESLARFRPDLDLLARLAAVTGTTAPLPVPVVPADWYTRRRVGTLRLLPGQRWLDLRAAETLQALRSEMAATLVSLGLPDFDVSAARGPSRDLTRHVARWAFERDFQGVAYRSRFADDLDCWVVFEGAAISPAGPAEAIVPDDVDLLAAAELFGLTIEP
ncbi:MAG TPA: RES domain-containing protein [Chloroflexota bacterium]|nr:RES domain-containing protein [Chloroflexota bacterium]